MGASRKHFMREYYSKASSADKADLFETEKDWDWGFFHRNESPIYQRPIGQEIFAALPVADQLSTLKVFFKNPEKGNILNTLYESLPTDKKVALFNHAMEKKPGNPERKLERDLAASLFKEETSDKQADLFCSSEPKLNSNAKGALFTSLSASEQHRILSSDNPFKKDHVGYFENIRNEFNNAGFFGKIGVGLSALVGTVVFPLGLAYEARRRVKHALSERQTLTNQKFFNDLLPEHQAKSLQDLLSDKLKSKDYEQVALDRFNGVKDLKKQGAILEAMLAGQEGETPDDHEKRKDNAVSLFQKRPLEQQGKMFEILSPSAMCYLIEATFIKNKNNIDQATAPWKTLSSQLSTETKTKFFSAMVQKNSSIAANLFRTEDPAEQGKFLSDMPPTDAGKLLSAYQKNQPLEVKERREAWGKMDVLKRADVFKNSDVNTQIEILTYKKKEGTLGKISFVEAQNERFFKNLSADDKAKLLDRVATATADDKPLEHLVKNPENTNARNDFLKKYFNCLDTSDAKETFKKMDSEAQLKMLSLGTDHDKAAFKNLKSEDKVELVKAMETDSRFNDKQTTFFGYLSSGDKAKTLDSTKDQYSSKLYESIKDVSAKAKVLKHMTNPMAISTLMGNDNNQQGVFNNLSTNGKAKILDALNTHEDPKVSSEILFDSIEGTTFKSKAAKQAAILESMSGSETSQKTASDLMESLSSKPQQHKAIWENFSTPGKAKMLDDHLSQRKTDSAETLFKLNSTSSHEKTQILKSLVNTYKRPADASKLFASLDKDDPREVWGKLWGNDREKIFEASDAAGKAKILEFKGSLLRISLVNTQNEKFFKDLLLKDKPAALDVLNKLNDETYDKYSSYFTKEEREKIPEALAQVSAEQQAASVANPAATLTVAATAPAPGAALQPNSVDEKKFRSIIGTFNSLGEKDRDAFLKGAKDSNSKEGELLIKTITEDNMTLLKSMVDEDSQRFFFKSLGPVERGYLNEALREAEKAAKTAVTLSAPASINTLSIAAAAPITPAPSSSAAAASPTPGISGRANEASTTPPVTTPPRATVQASPAQTPEQNALIFKLERNNDDPDAQEKFFSKLPSPEKVDLVKGMQNNPNDQYKFFNLLNRSEQEAFFKKVNDENKAAKLASATPPTSAASQTSPAQTPAERNVATFKLERYNDNPDAQEKFFSKLPSPEKVDIVKGMKNNPNYQYKFFNLLNRSEQEAFFKKVNDENKAAKLAAKSKAPPLGPTSAATSPRSQGEKDLAQQIKLLQEKLQKTEALLKAKQERTETKQHENEKHLSAASPSPATAAPPLAAAVATPPQTPAVKPLTPTSGAAPQPKPFDQKKFESKVELLKEMKDPIKQKEFYATFSNTEKIKLPSEPGLKQLAREMDLALSNDRAKRTPAPSNYRGLMPASTAYAKAASKPPSQITAPIPAAPQR